MISRTYDIIDPWNHRQYHRFWTVISCMISHTCNLSVQELIEGWQSKWSMTIGKITYALQSPPAPQSTDVRSNLLANDLLVWKHSLVAHAGATFTIWNDQFCAVLILRPCWRLHTCLGCCHCCCRTRIGRRGITTSVRGRGSNHLTITLQGPATEPGNHFAGQVHLELVVVSLLKHFQGISILIVTDAGDPCVRCPEEWRHCKICCHVGNQRPWNDPGLRQSWSGWRQRNRWVHSLNQPPDKLGLIPRKLEGSKAFPFVHILQYKEKEFAGQSVVCRCSEEVLFWIIRWIDAVGALAWRKSAGIPTGRKGHSQRIKKISWYPNQLRKSAGIPTGRKGHSQRIKKISWYPNQLRKSAGIPTERKEQSKRTSRWFRIL